MTGYTPGSALPFPQGGDAVAVHTDVQALAAKADAELALKPSRTETSDQIDEATAPLASRSWVSDQIGTAVTYLGDGVYDIA